MTTKICANCHQPFEVKPYMADKAKYCSRKCYQEARWGGNGICPVCGEITRTRYCSPECQREFWNKNDYHLRKKARNWERKLALIEALGGKCSHCGIDDIRVLDINHIDPDVKHHHTTGYTWTRRLKDWEENLDSIELLCANCHRIHTWEQQGYGIVNGNVICS